MNHLDVWVSRRAQHVLHLRHLPSRFTIVGTKTAGLPPCWAFDRVREDVRHGCTLFRVSYSTARWLLEEARKASEVASVLDRDNRSARAAGRLAVDLEMLLEGVEVA